MKRQQQQVHLTSAELASLWTQYQNDSMAICFIRHALTQIGDRDIQGIYERALRQSTLHISEITNFFNGDNYPLPIGFTDEDVHLDAPPLFSDPLLLHYIFVMSLQGMAGYAGSVGSSTRADVRKYFIQCSTDAMDLYDLIVDTMLQKGIISKAPSIGIPNRIDFVNDQSYLNGWLGKQRPLNAVEISGLVFNSQKIMIKIVLEMGFSQVTQSKELVKYFKRGERICKKHVKIIGAILRESDLTTPRTWESEVTTSTTAPFSNKLMLYHVVTLISTAIGFYGAGVATSQRRDLGLQYTKLIAEIILYAEDGINLLIKNGWLEEPPMAPDREALANQNKNP